MFWIAQPKAASSSLGETMAEILNVKVLNALVTEPKIFCEGFPEIQKWHNSMVPRTMEFLQKMYDDKTIMYKEHILPTEEHLNIVRTFGKPLMILLRNPADTFDAYIRFNETACVKRYGKKVVDLNQIENDVQLFYWNYKTLEQKKYDHLLFIYYKDLMLNFTETLKKIFDHYGWELPENYKEIELKKIKYTGVGIERLKNEYIG